MSDSPPGSQARIEDRVPRNVPGKFFVDNTCLDCDLCCETAPENFSRDDDRGVAYVSRQPVTPDELARCQECVIGCPCESIGDTGDQHDWATLPPVEWPIAPSDEPRHCRCRATKPWWRFW